ncbi:XkdX family protein [Bacillus sp. ISL-46]|nr:XkdX family protein [Bacillus sp. ISL-46]MBT2722323.1 XkdX family protein [Bacillus sp. ISL-46]
MDWYSYAKNDWAIYHDATRIHKYVEFGKITAVQYEEITGEPYLA